MYSKGTRRSLGESCANNSMRKIYECLKMCNEEYAKKENKNEQFLQSFGCTPMDIPQETFSFLTDSVQENVWEHMNILPVYIATTCQDVLSDIHENVFEEQFKTIDRKVKVLQRKKADMQRKLDYNMKIQEIENKFSETQAFLYNARKAVYKRELISKTLCFQDVPNLAQIFIEIKEMNKKLNTLKDDIGTAKAKLSKYGRLPPSVHEAKIVTNETITEYNKDATKMKTMLEGNPTYSK